MQSAKLSGEEDDVGSFRLEAVDTCTAMQAAMPYLVVTKSYKWPFRDHEVLIDYDFLVTPG